MRNQIERHLASYMIRYEVFAVYEKNFAVRLAQLRMQKGVSARDMSLSLGQSASYINTIEAGKSFPSMTAFFYICEYLGVSPMEFFDFASESPWQMKELGEKKARLELLCRDSEHMALSPRQIEAILTLVDGIAAHK